MTTKETEKKLKIAKNAGIYCPTLKLAKQVLNIFNDLGLKWYSDVSYIKCTNWDSHKENTVYYPFNGTLSSLKYAQQNDYKIISAEKFIALHTEDFDLETYEPKGELEGFPKEIIAKMLDYQEEQGNKRDISVFEREKEANNQKKGFNWLRTQEEQIFWIKVISYKNFNVFFEKYPKKEDSQVFKLGDKVYDILCKSSGIITNVSIGRTDYPLTVELENGKINIYTIDGRLNSYFKTPQLLHRRDDYNYDIIDFNNLPKRQEANRWRAEVGEKYYYFNTYFEVHSFLEEYSNTDTKLYDLGDYFQTKEQAQEVADKLKNWLTCLRSAFKN